MRHAMRVISPFALLALAGCFSLGRDTPALQQYVLGGAPPAAGAAAGNLAGLTIGVRRLDLAPYLAVPAIVVRRGAHQIVVSEYHRWAEDPGEGINRAVAGYLAAGAPLRAVEFAPWSVRSRYDYLIQLHVARFEGVAPEDSAAPHGEAHMLTTWEIIGQQDGAVLARGATDYRAQDWQVGDYAGLVTLLDRGLNAVARDLATCLRTLVSATTLRTDDDSEPGSVRGPVLVCAPRAE